MRTLCKVCKGHGQTRNIATIVRRVNGKMKTEQLGYGCLTCLGKGVTDSGK